MTHCAKHVLIPRTSLKFRVVLCQIRLFPTLISKIKWLGSELPLRNFMSRMSQKTVSQWNPDLSCIANTVLESLSSILALSFGLGVLFRCIRSIDFDLDRVFFLDFLGDRDLDFFLDFSFDLDLFRSFDFFRSRDFDRLRSRLLDRFRFLLSRLRLLRLDFFRSLERDRFDDFFLSRLLLLLDFDRLRVFLFEFDFSSSSTSGFDSGRFSRKSSSILSTSISSAILNI